MTEAFRSIVDEAFSGWPDVVAVGFVGVFSAFFLYAVVRAALEHE